MELIKLVYASIGTGLSTPYSLTDIVWGLVQPPMERAPA